MLYGVYLIKNECRKCTLINPDKKRLYHKHRKIFNLYKKIFYKSFVINNKALFLQK